MEQDNQALRQKSKLSTSSPIRHYDMAIEGWRGATEAGWERGDERRAGVSFHNFGLIIT
jgi:hypothetical protein